MTTRFWEAIANMKRLMDELHNGKECKWCEYREAPSKGVYVLYENRDPIYVGRSNHMAAVFESMERRVQPTFGYIRVASF